MAGIYIHVPFCSKKCYYCDFYSSTNTLLTDSYTNSLIREIELRSKFFSYLPTNEQVVKTIYLGGGTPSLLSISQLEEIFEKLSKTFQISNEAEITIEVNPDDLSLDYLKSIKALDVNRLSMGVQSFDDALLKLMNRRHNADQAEKSIEMALSAGFDNLSIDLIYGLPGLSNSLWQSTLEKVFRFPIQHISAYHLGIEEGTVFSNWLKKGKIREMNEDDSWEQFRMLNEIAVINGFEHYEISNLAKPGFRSQHNTAYWNNVSYLGLGPSAHSFNGTQRSWNVSNIKQYNEALENNSPFSESETLTTENRLNEYLMTHLRTKEGIHFQYLKEHFGQENFIRISQQFEKLVNAGMANINATHGFLTLKGWFVSDKIISELIS